MSSPLYTDPLNTQLPICEVYEGRNLPGFAVTNVTALTFLTIAGDKDTASGAPSVTTAAAGGETCGVAAYTVAAGQLTGLVRGNARVVRVAAGAAITAGQQVQVGANGTAVPVPSSSPGIAVGYAIDTAAAGTLAQISLY